MKYRGVDILKITYDIPKLERIITDLTRLTDVRMNFCDSTGQVLTHLDSGEDYCTMLQRDKKNKEKCLCSDALILEKCKKSRKIESHICYAGLCDIAMPIIKRDTVVGFVIMGRLRTPDTTFEAEGYDMPYFSKSKLESLVGLLPQILFESAVHLEDDGILDKVMRYIDTHLCDALDIETLCSIFHVSKNCLYREFREGAGCTVGEYITDRRIRTAKEMLTSTKAPVYRVAEAVGIDNYTYFCRMFKKNTGVSPVYYRKNN